MTQRAMTKPELAEALTQAKTLNTKVDQLIADINDGTVTYLPLVPDWAHDAVSSWADDSRHSLSSGWMAHVDAAVRCFYSVERRCRRDEEKVEQERALMRGQTLYEVRRK